MPYDTYSAFISYSHAGDHRLAKSLQGMLGMIARPWYRRRELDVFLDESDLAASPDLWKSIEQALNKTRYLILLASPESAASKWVNQEITHFLDRENRTEEQILIAVTAGKLEWDDEAKEFAPDQTDCLPPALINAFEREPLWVDFSAYRRDEDLSRSNPGFFDGCARLAARVHGKNLSELVSEDYRQHRRTMTIAWFAVISLVLLTGFAIFSSIQANRNAAEAIAALELSNANKWAAELRGSSLLLQADIGHATDALNDETVFPSDQRGLAWQILKARSNHLLAEYLFPSPVKTMMTSKRSKSDNSVLIATKDGRLWEWKAGKVQPKVIANLGQMFTGWVHLSDSGQIAFEREGKAVLARLDNGIIVTQTEIPSACGNLVFDGEDPANPGVITYCDKIIKWWDARSGAENTAWRIERDLNPQPESEEDWVEPSPQLTAFSGASRRYLWFSTLTSYDEGASSSATMLDLETLKQSNVHGVLSPEKVIHVVPLNEQGTFLIMSQLYDLATYAPPIVRRVESDRENSYSYSEQAAEIISIAGSERQHAVLNMAGGIRLLDANLTRVTKVLRLPVVPSEISSYRLMLSTKGDSLYVLDEEGRMRVFSAEPEALKSSAGLSGARVESLAKLGDTGAIYIERQGPGSEDNYIYQWYLEPDVLVTEYTFLDEQYLEVDSDTSNSLTWIEVEDIWTGGVLTRPLDGYQGEAIAVSADRHAYLFKRYSNEKGYTFNYYEDDIKVFIPLFTETNDEKELTYAAVQSGIVASGFTNGSIEVYRRSSATSFQLERSCPVDGSFPVVKLSPDGRYLVALTLIDPENDDSFYDFKPMWLLTNSVFENEESLAKGAKLFLLDLEDNGCNWREVGNAASYLAEGVAFHVVEDKNALQLLFGNIDGAVTLHDIEHGTSMQLNIGFTGPITAIKTGLDNQLFVSGQTARQRIGTKVVDIENGIELIELRLADLAVEHVLFDQEKRTLALATEDGRVWWLQL